MISDDLCRYIIDVCACHFIFNTYIINLLQFSGFGLGKFQKDNGCGINQGFGRIEKGRDKFDGFRTPPTPGHTQLLMKYGIISHILLYH